MHCSFSHSEVVELSSLADPSLLCEIDACDDNVSLGEELEHEVYSLVHFGASESHTPKPLMPLNTVETQRYFKNTVVCYRCKTTGHIGINCKEIEKHVCSLCGSTQHKKNVCPQRICRICGELGHPPDYCPRRTQQNRVVCITCGSRFHLAADCTDYRKKIRVHEPSKPLHRACCRCGEEGHFASTCPHVPGMYSSTFYVEPGRYNGHLLPALASETRNSTTHTKDSATANSSNNEKEKEKEKGKDDIPKKGKPKNRKKR
ncbi:hypothetical protein NECID01_1074 [Nematocida sp. AWRm77]|nr:hypothetical protein NECID01_1074 [Nematocida sp. AWRm77]